MSNDWVNHTIWWQIYPLGFVGAFPANPDAPAEEHRLRRIVAWLDHAIELGASGLALGPVFASRTHGYDTTDYFRIDPRLGDDADFDFVVSEAHRRGLRVLLDGVFNHVGADFTRYQEALSSGPEHPASSWFHRRGNKFRSFEGHDELVTLNHGNPAVIAYVAEVMNHWLGRGADGWRLDAAYAVPPRFWADVLPRVRSSHPNAWFVAEVIHGDYPRQVDTATFDSVTQYELWKAIWSSLNDENFHELDWALRRHNEFVASFVPLTFIGNHDVTRIASRLENPDHVALAMVLLFTVGGAPSVYAGDEFAGRAVKEDRAGGDDAVRPEFGSPPTDLDHEAEGIFRLYQHLIGLRRRHPWLVDATTAALLVDNTRYVYAAHSGRDTLIAALNLSDEPMPVVAAELGYDRFLIVGGTGAPAESVVDEAVAAAHGWLILEPA